MIKIDLKDKKINKVEYEGAIVSLKDGKGTGVIIGDMDEYDIYNVVMLNHEYSNYKFNNYYGEYENINSILHDFNILRYAGDYELTITD